jgi:exportin-1
LQDIFYVLTDSFHKSGFKLQATILMQMFTTVERGGVNAPLWDPQVIQDQSMTNQRFIREYVTNLLGSAFTNLTAPQIRHFVVGVFDPNKDLAAFKNHLRDFLVQLKEFSGDNEELYLEEKEAALAAARDAATKRALAIPGLLPPNEQPDDMND